MGRNDLAEDITVPISRMPEALRDIQEISRRHGIRIAIPPSEYDLNSELDFPVSSLWVR